MAVAIADVMRHVRNFFNRGFYRGEISITGNTLLPAQAAPYVAIQGSAYHDGVYAVIDGYLQGMADGLPDETFSGLVWQLYPPADFIRICEQISAYDEKKAEGVHPWLLVSQGSSALCGGRHALCYGDGGADLAANLFHSLRILDSKGATHIYCEAVDTEGIGLAAMNRLLRAAEFDIIDL